MKRIFLSTVIVITVIVADVPLIWLVYFLHFPEEGHGGIPHIVLNALLLILFALIHSLLIRNPAKRYVARLAGERFVKVVYVLIAGLTLSALLYLWQPISGALWLSEGGLYWILSFFYLVCIAALAYTIFLTDFMEFLGLRLILQAVRNRPYIPPSICLKGLYGHCRHPMYLLTIIALWVGPVMTYGRFEFALLASCYFIIGASLEEHNLREQYGEFYDVYRVNVPMWIPRLRPWKLKKP